MNEFEEKNFYSTEEQTEPVNTAEVQSEYS